MHHVRIEDLPLVGVSRQFWGEREGDTNVSIYFVTAPPGKRVPPHRHPYDELALVQQGTARWTVNGVTHTFGTGDVVVVKAGEVHTFENVGTDTLVQIDLHLSPRFEQEAVADGTD